MKHGGNRLNAGRKKGTGKFGYPTKAIRVPENMVDSIYNFIDNNTNFAIPLFSSKISAGFPSPADDYIESQLDLNQHLITNPCATFFLKVSGDSMIEAGISEGDLLIVDKSLTPAHGKVVIAAYNGELTVKRLYKKNNIIKLMPENKNYNPIVISQESELFIWGVVTSVIKKI